MQTLLNFKRPYSYSRTDVPAIEAVSFQYAPGELVA